MDRTVADAWLSLYCIQKNME